MAEEEISVTLKLSHLGGGTIEDSASDIKVATVGSMTIGSLKRAHCGALLDAGKSLRFIFLGKVLDDDQMIGEIAHFGLNGTIHVIVRDGVVEEPLYKISVRPEMLSLGSILVSGGGLVFAWRRNKSRNSSVVQLYYLLASLWLYWFLSTGIPLLSVVCGQVKEAVRVFNDRRNQKAATTRAVIPPDGRQSTS